MRHRIYYCLANSILRKVVLLLRLDSIADKPDLSINVRQHKEPCLIYLVEKRSFIDLLDERTPILPSSAENAFDHG